MSVPARTRQSHETCLRAVRLLCQDRWRPADAAAAFGRSTRSVPLRARRSDQEDGPKLFYSVREGRNQRLPQSAARNAA